MPARKGSKKGALAKNKKKSTQSVNLTSREPQKVAQEDVIIEEAVSHSCQLKNSVTCIQEVRHRVGSTIFQIYQEPSV